ncbi:hypothetical protein BA81_12395 [Bacillus safensis FO-36b]|uniref:DUF4145 domain-containing protein n=1 Tax=Bacillus safensis TaxID=561879 RepID=UPI00045C6DEF|nr:hypothetical protein BA81_12395 [Bacillus safensis FO-36b]
MVYLIAFYWNGVIVILKRVEPMDKVSEKLYCRACTRKTNHNIVTNEHGHKLQLTDSYLNYEEADICFYVEYSIVQCRGCDSISFLRRYKDDEMYYVYGPDPNIDREYYEEYTVYPEEPKEQDNPENLFQLKEKIEFKGKFEFKHLPDLISGIRNEAIDAYKNRMNLLCNTGIRMTIEAICKVNEIDKIPKMKKGEIVLDNENKPKMENLNLFKKIEELHKRELINEKQKQILNQIRDIGNETVHEIKRPKSRELIQYIDIIDFILYNIYELPNLSFEKEKS